MMNPVLKNFLKVFICIVLYVALFFVLLTISYYFFDLIIPYSYSSKIIRYFATGVSYLTPMLFSYQYQPPPWGPLIVQPFNPFFVLINVLYTYLVYRLLYYLYKKVRQKKQKKTE